MAISLIPDNQQFKKSYSQSFIQTFALGKGTVFEIAILILLIAIYFGTLFWVSSIQNNIEEKKIQKEAILSLTRAEQVTETKIFASRVRALKIVVEEHIEASELLGEFDQSAHLAVVFTSFELDLENNTLAVEGLTANFEILGEQFMLWKKKSDFVHDVSLESFDKNNEGRIEFSAILKLAK